MSEPSTPEGFPPNNGLPQFPAARPPQQPPAPQPSAPPEAAAPPPAPIPPAATPPAATPAPPAAAPAQPPSAPAAKPADPAARLRRSPDLPPAEPPRPAPQPAAGQPAAPQPAPQEDAAARFRKPAPAPAPAATPAPVVSGEAPGLGELAERALTGLLLGRSAFEPLASRPAPSYGAMTLLALGFAALALALNAALTAVAQPALLGSYPAWFYAAVTAGALGISLAWLLLSATVLFALGKALGGKAGFERGYQAAALLFALAPVQSLASLLPYAWLAPSLLFAWAGAGALAGLLGAAFPGALTVCSMLAALSIAGQGVARAVFAKSQQVLAQSQALMQAGAGAADAARLMQAVQQVQQLQSAPPSGGAPAPIVGDLDEAPEEGAAAAPGASGLDLIGGGQAQPGGAPTPQEQRQAHAQADVLRMQAVAMLESALPMMDNPAITKNLDAQGKKDVAELKALLLRFKGQAAGDAKISDQEFNATMQKMQALSMRVMAAGMAGAAKAPAAKPAAGEKR